MQYKFLTLLTFLTIINFEGCERLFRAPDMKRISVTSSYNIGDYEILVTDNGEYLYFGEYPQQIICKWNEELLKNELDKLKSDDNEVIYYNDEKYIKYITDDILNLGDDVLYYNLGYAAKSGDINYYKFEPILWRIISKDDTSLTLSSYNVLDGMYLMDLNNIYAYDEDNNKLFITDLINSENREDYKSKLEYFKCTYNVNTNEKVNYDDSDLRKWLNVYFYSIAFNDEEKEKMKCINDDDFVSLPKKEDIDETIKVFQATDYCISKGVSLGKIEFIHNAEYLLSDNDSYYRVNAEGIIGDSEFSFNTIFNTIHSYRFQNGEISNCYFQKEGIKPIIKIKI